MSPFFNHILSAILLTPLAGALVILFVSRERTAAIRWIANGFAAAGCLVSIPLWFVYEPHGKTWQFAERGEWIPALGVSYYVGVDGFSILLILLTTLMTWVALLASWNAITERVKEFHVVMLVLQAGLLGAFIALDFLLFFVFWEVTLVAMYFLIRTWGGGGRGASARRFVSFTLAGSVAMLVGILALYFSHHAAAGVYSFDITLFQTVSVPPAIQTAVFLAFFVACAVMVPMLPFHAWLPDAQAEAPTAGSVMLAAVVLKMGTYGFIRFALPILPDASKYFVPMIVALAVVGVIYGAVAAFAQRDWKRLVAYSAVSQMAIIMLGLFALTPVAVTGSIVQQINHGISTGALFLLAGIAYDRTHTLEISAYGGLAKAMPVFAAVFLIMTLSAIGLPLLNGFVGGRLIVQGVYDVSKWWAGVAAFGILLGAGYLLWLYKRTMFGRVGNSAHASLRDLTPRELATVAPLVALVVGIGLYPAPLLRRIETSVGRVVARVDPAYGPMVAQGSDCATPAPPDPAGPPPVFVLVEPCADGTEPPKKPDSTPER